MNRLARLANLVVPFFGGPRWLQTYQGRYRTIYFGLAIAFRPGGGVGPGRSQGSPATHGPVGRAGCTRRVGGRDASPTARDRICHGAVWLFSRGRWAETEPPAMQLFPGQPTGASPERALPENCADRKA